jgi:hypothetical protein
MYKPQNRTHAQKVLAEMVVEGTRPSWLKETCWIDRFSWPENELTIEEALARMSRSDLRSNVAQALARGEAPVSPLSTTRIQNVAIILAVYTHGKSLAKSIEALKALKVLRSKTKVETVVETTEPTAEVSVAAA